MVKHESFLAPHINAFVRYRQASEFWNDTSYGVNLLLFDRHCARNYPDATELEQEMVDSWCRQRENEENNSCRSRIYVVVSLVRYMRERGLTDVSEPEIPRKERSTYVPHAFTDEELANFFRSCDSLPVSRGHWDSVLRKLTVPVFFRLLYSSGLRTTEARKLRVVDVDLEHGVLDIRQSKGYDQHFVVLHDSMLDLMRRYDGAVGKMAPDRTYFFPAREDSYHRAPWVQKNFRLAWDSANNCRNVVPYELRHHYAIENINSWVDLGLSFEDRLVYLSKSMGHGDLESTKRYYSLTPVMSDIIERHSGESFEWIVPEVADEEIY